MRSPFRNTYGEPILQYRLSAWFLVSTLVATITALHDYPWLAGGVGSLIVLAYLHDKSDGRTSPLAAAVFVLCGPFAAAVIVFIYAMYQLRRKAMHMPVAEDEILSLASTVTCVGLMIAALVAVIAAFQNRRYWFDDAVGENNALYESLRVHSQVPKQNLSREQVLKPAVRFRVTDWFLAVALLAIVTSLHSFSWYWLAVGAGSLLFLFYMHRLSEGRTSPLAAATFVFCGPVAGVAFGIFSVFDRALGYTSLSYASEADIQAYAVRMISIGLLSAVVVSLVLAYEKRDEWFNHL